MTLNIFDSWEEGLVLEYRRLEKLDNRDEHTVKRMKEIETIFGDLPLSEKERTYIQNAYGQG